MAMTKSKKLSNAKKKSALRARKAKALRMKRFSKQTPAAGP